METEKISFSASRFDSKYPEKKLQAIDLYNNGVSVSYIAKILQTTQMMVRHWIKRGIHEGLTCISSDDSSPCFSSSIMGTDYLAINLEDSDKENTVAKQDYVVIDLVDSDKEDPVTKQDYVVIDLVDSDKENSITKNYEKDNKDNKDSKETSAKVAKSQEDLIESKCNENIVSEKRLNMFALQVETDMLNYSPVVEGETKGYMGQDLDFLNFTKYRTQQWVNCITPIPPDEDNEETSETERAFEEYDYLTWQQLLRQAYAYNEGIYNILVGLQIAHPRLFRKMKNAPVDDVFDNPNLAIENLQQLPNFPLDLTSNNQTSNLPLQEQQQNIVTNFNLNCQQQPFLVNHNLEQVLISNPIMNPYESFQKQQYQNPNLALKQIVHTEQSNPLQHSFISESLNNKSMQQQYDTVVNSNLNEVMQEYKENQSAALNLNNGNHFLQQNSQQNLPPDYRVTFQNLISDSQPNLNNNRQLLQSHQVQQHQQDIKYTTVQRMNQNKILQMSTVRKSSQTKKRKLVRNKKKSKRNKLNRNFKQSLPQNDKVEKIPTKVDSSHQQMTQFFEHFNESSLHEWLLRQHQEIGELIMTGWYPSKYQNECC